MEYKLSEALTYLSDHEYAKGLELLQELSETSPRAQYNLAMLYYQGKGVEPSLIKALEYAEKSHENGYAKADKLLEILHDKRREVAFIKEAIFVDLDMLPTSEEESRQTQPEDYADQVLDAKSSEPKPLAELQHEELSDPVEAPEIDDAADSLLDDEEEASFDSLDGAEQDEFDPMTDDSDEFSEPEDKDESPEILEEALNYEPDSSDFEEEVSEEQSEWDELGDGLDSLEEPEESDIGEFDLPELEEDSFETEPGGGLDDSPEEGLAQKPESPDAPELMEESFEELPELPEEQVEESPIEELDSLDEDGGKIESDELEVSREEVLPASSKPAVQKEPPSDSLLQDEESEAGEKGGKKRLKELNVADKFITLQVIFILAFLVVLGVAYYFFSDAKSNFESFKREELELLNQSNEITQGLSELKTLIMVASLRKGDDYMEMQKINQLTFKMGEKAAKIKSAAEILQDKKMDDLGVQLVDGYDKFIRLAGMMPEDFKESFEEGIDTLGAVDSLNAQLVKTIKSIEARIQERTDEKVQMLNDELDEAMLYMMVIGVVATLMSLLIYLSSSQLRKLNKTLDGMVEERTKELDSALTIIKAYTDAIDNSVITCKFDYLGEILDANGHFCTISGYSKNELIGKDMGEFNIYDEQTYPTRYLRWGSILKELIAKKEWSGVLIFRAKNARNFYTQTTISPIESGEGEVIEFLALMQDITKLEENRLEQLTQSVDMALDIKLDQVMSLIPYPTVALDRHSKITEHNEAFKELFDFIEDEDSIEALEGETLVFDALMQEEGECVYPDGVLDWKESLLALDMDETQCVCLYLGGENRIFKVRAKQIELDDQEKVILSLSE